MVFFFFIRDVETSPLLLELRGIVRVVERFPIRRAYPVESRSVLTGEGRFLFYCSVLCYMVGAGFLSLVVF